MRVASYATDRKRLKIRWYIDCVSTKQSFDGVAFMVPVTVGTGVLQPARASGTAVTHATATVQTAAIKAYLFIASLFVLVL